jgi:hypothetical protein
LGIVCLLAALEPACAQPAAGAVLTGPYRIAGTVVNAITGEPVRGAMMAILTIQDSHIFASTESGEGGRFTLEHLPAAKFQLTASKRGYSTSFYNEHDGGYNSAIVTGAGPGAGEDTGNLVFKLTPSAVLNGVVTGDGGDPVEGATVMLFEKPRGHEPGAKIGQAGTAMTDDTGAYEFADLSPGEYMLAVKAQPWYAITHSSIGSGPTGGPTGETEAQAALDVAYPMTFFDSTTDESSATPIALAGGSRQQANLSLHAVPALRLEVNAPDQQEGKNAHPRLRQSIFGIEIGTGGEDVQYDDRTGKTEFAGVAPGPYELTQGDPPRVLEMDATANQQVDPDAGVPTVTVTATLRDTMGSPLTGLMTVTLEPVDGGGAGATDPSLIPSTVPFLVQPIVQPVSGSSFTAPVVAGVWAVQVQGQNGAMPVLSLMAGGQKLQGNRITVQDQPLSLIVTVSASTARVEGFARRSDRGFAGAMVVLVPRNLAAIAELARRDQSDSDGSFALLDVAPGEYTVVAIQDGWDLDWANPAVIARYLPDGTAVTVKDSRDHEPDRRVLLSDPVMVQAR